MADDRLQACPFCLTDIHELATICAGCGATRRRLGAAWVTPRSALRNDVAVGVLGALVVVICFSIVWSIVVALLT